MKRYSWDRFSKFSRRRYLYFKHLLALVRELIYNLVTPFKIELVEFVLPVIFVFGAFIAFSYVIIVEWEPQQWWKEQAENTKDAWRLGIVSLATICTTLGILPNWFKYVSKKCKEAIKEFRKSFCDYFKEYHKDKEEHKEEQGRFKKLIEKSIRHNKGDSYVKGKMKQFNNCEKHFRAIHRSMQDGDFEDRPSCSCLRRIPRKSRVGFLKNGHIVLRFSLNMISVIAFVIIVAIVAFEANGPAETEANGATETETKDPAETEANGATETEVAPPDCPCPSPVVVPEIVRPVVGFPVFFGNARANRNGEINENSQGVKLQDGQKRHLEEVAELLRRLIGSQKNPPGFLVVGYASATPIDICRNCNERGSQQLNMEKNIDVANLRAKGVAEVLRNKMKQINPEIQVESKEWKDYTSLESCRPYRPDLLPVVTSDDSILERMNQSVMIYAMPETNNDNESNCLSRPAEGNGRPDPEASPGERATVGR